MVNSVVKLQREVAMLSSALVGRTCLHHDEIDFLTELVKLLKPFKHLTDPFSCSSPAMSVIPLFH